MRWTSRIAISLMLLTVAGPAPAGTEDEVKALFAKFVAAQNAHDLKAVTRSAQSIMASGFTAAQTGRTHDRTRPMLHKRQKVLAKAVLPVRTSLGLSDIDQSTR
jgi:hypothetical protein